MGASHVGAVKVTGQGLEEQSLFTTLSNIMGAVGSSPWIQQRDHEVDDSSPCTAGLRMCAALSCPYKSMVCAYVLFHYVCHFGSCETQDESQNSSL